MRLTALPFWWMTDPSRASRETKKMFGEKEDAFFAMQQELMMAPARFWLDAWQGMLGGDRDGGIDPRQAHHGASGVGHPTALGSAATGDGCRAGEEGDVQEP